MYQKGLRVLGKEVPWSDLRIKSMYLLHWNTAKSELDYPWSSLSGKRIGSQATLGVLHEFNPIAWVCLNSISKAELIECFRNYFLQHMCQ